MIEVYTDGAFTKDNHRGVPQMGWAFVIVKDGEKIYHDCGGEEHGTNNIAEMFGIKNAILWLQSQSIEEALIITDSKYCIGGFTKVNKRNKNVELWEEMDRLENTYPFKHVKGHSGHKWNDMVDMWACHGRDLILE